MTEWSAQGLFPIGRLDKDSEGLLILTDDGRVANWILGPESGVEKEYLVWVREKLRSGIVGIFARGMRTEPYKNLLPAQAKILSPHLLAIILHEGKKHQIRVMLSELGYTITRLKRVRVGSVRLGQLRPGEFRPLTPKELTALVRRS
jgi:23S rRNA pseudouridine2604 synthase